MFALDLFNNDHERRIAEGAVDQLEQRRIDDLAMKMDDLVARARKATTPEAKAALVKEFQKCKAERDSYYKIRNETMGYGTLVGEEEMDEGGIPGNVPTEKIPGKEDLLKGRGRTYYESQKKNSEQVNEYLSMASDKNFVEAPSYKNYKIYVRKKPFGNTGIYTAHTEIDRKGFMEKGSSQEEAVQAIRDRIDFILNAQKKVTGSSTIDFNVKFATDLLANPRQTFYAKLENINGEPKLVIAGPEVAGDPELLAAGDFKRSAVRNQVDDQGRATPLPGIPLTAKGLRSGEWIANGRYTVGKETQDQDGNRVFDLTYHSTAHTKSDKLRLNQPAFTLGTAREVDEHGGGIGPGQHWQDLMPEGWSNKMVARRTGQAPTPYSVYIKGKEWKSFADDDHAEAVANKLRAKFKQEGRDPSVITIAATGYDKDLEEARRVRGGDYQLKLVDRQEDNDTDLDDVVTDYYFDVYQNGQKVGHAQGDSYYGELVVKADFNREFKLDTFHDKDHPLIKQFEKFQQQLNELAQGNGEDNSDDLTDAAFKDGQRLGMSLVDGATRAQGFEASRYLDRYLIPFSYGWNSGRKAKIAQARKDGVELAMKKDGSLVRSGVEESATAPIIVPKRKRKEKPEPKFHIPYSADDYVPPAVQIARDEAAKKKGVAEAETDQVKKVFKKNGKPVGEVGIDPEASPGNGQWYMKCYSPKMDYSGYDSFEEAVKELGYCLSRGVAESKEAVFKDHKIEVEYPEGRGHSHIYHRREPYRLSSIFSDANSVASRNRRATVSLFVDGEYIPNYEWQEGVDAPNGGIGEGQTDYSKRRQRERDVDAGKPVAKPRQPKQTDYQKRRAQDKRDMELGEESSTSSDAVERAILNRIMVAHTDLLMKFGPEKVMQAAEEVAYNVGDVDEIGTSDVSAYVAQVKQILGVAEELDEKWSQKYKKSINCSNPKGFSQKAHCAGRKK